MTAELYFTGKPCKHGHIAPRFKSTRICTECNRENSRKRYDPEKRKLRTDKSANANKNYKRWYDKNQKKALANTRRQQAARLKRVPKWSEINLIENFYENCPVGYEVDHILPLQGKLVSGLHVFGNLQYLAIIENRSKGNKVDL